MSKVLIDRALLERVQERLDPHRDAVLWGAVCDTFHTAPSGTPAMPVKAYYHEWTDLEGVRTRSVGLEVRKEFTDAPLVLESDALAQIACLEGEIAKRDARIAELENDVSYYASRNEGLRAELAAIKAQDTVGEVVGWYRLDRPYEMTPYPSVCATWHRLGAPVAPLYAAHAQQVSVPDGWRELAKRADDFLYSLPETDGVLRLRADLCSMLAAPAAPAADAGIVDMYRHLQKVTPYRFKKIQDASVTDGGDVLYFHKDRFDAALLDDMAANCSKESK